MRIIIELDDVDLDYVYEFADQLMEEPGVLDVTVEDEEDETL